jgi:hypothetical protein
VIWAAWIGAVLASGFFVFWVVRGLWHRATALWRQVDEAAAAVSRLDEPAEVEPNGWTHPLLVTAEDRAWIRAGLESRRADRAERRRLRDLATYERWKAWT